MQQVDSTALDGLQQAVIQSESKNKTKEKPKYNFDKLKLYFGEDYKVQNIIISQPTIGDILEVGEAKFYQALSPFLRNSTSIRVMLWDVGIDWCKVKDIEVFQLLINMPEIDKSPLNILFKTTNITGYALYKIPSEDGSCEQMLLYNAKENIILSEDDFMEIAEYIRTMMDVHPKVEKAKGKTAKSWMIDEDRIKALHSKDKSQSSTLLPLVSACINHPGFKYKLKELKDVGIYEFMDSVQRLQIYESTRALMSGIYSGFCDTSKIDKNQFNFMREM